MVPVGGVSTIGAQSAASLVRQMEPRIVLPMHFQTPSLAALEPVQGFLREMGLHEVIPQAKLGVNKNNLPLAMQVVLLDYPSARAGEKASQSPTSLEG
jgi:hypothetical protein